MYPRAVDTGNTSGLNVNLTRNYKIPTEPTAARAACMADPGEFNYTVDITHEHSMAWVKNQDGVRVLVVFIFDCHFAVQRGHFITDFPAVSVAVFLK
jgi:hypothetical protein